MVAVARGTTQALRARMRIFRGKNATAQRHEADETRRRAAATCPIAAVSAAHAPPHHAAGCRFGARAPTVAKDGKRDNFDTRGSKAPSR